MLLQLTGEIHCLLVVCLADERPSPLSRGAEQLALLLYSIDCVQLQMKEKGSRHWQKISYITCRKKLKTPLSSSSICQLQENKLVCPLTSMNPDVMSLLPALGSKCLLKGKYVN